MGGVVVVGGGIAGVCGVPCRCRVVVVEVVCFGGIGFVVVVVVVVVVDGVVVVGVSVCGRVKV